MNPKELEKELKDSALEYREEFGFSVIPVNPESKKPLVKTWKPYQTEKPSIEQINEWWNRWSKAAIGIVTGPVSSLLVLDIDDPEGWKYVTETKRIGSEPTPIARTGGGGWHIYYSYPEGSNITVGARIGDEDLGLDFRGKTGYVIAPPSRHPSGDRYRWDKSLKEYTPTSPPDWLLRELEKKDRPPGNVDDLLEGVKEGKRNNAATKVAGRYLAKFKEENWNLTWESLRTWNRRNEPPLPEKELKRTFESVAKRERSKNNPSNEKNGTKKEGEQSAHQKLLRIVDSAEFFQTAENRLFAEVPERGKVVIKEIAQRGGGFRLWLVREYEKIYEEAPHSNAITRTMESVKARADDADEKKIYNRVADLGDRIYLDLASKETKKVEIDPEGYRTVEQSPVNFWRPEGARGLPEPEGGVEDLQLLDGLLSLDRNPFLLLIGWMTNTFQTTGPYPVLIPSGSAGTGKSVLTKLIRMVLDPAGGSERAVVQSLRQSDDLFSVAKNRHIIALDNISSLRGWQSDALSTVATGGGVEKRKLYTDSELATIDTMNPIVFNGIDITGIGNDLLDRAIFLELEEPEKRISENKFWSDIRELRPEILGGLCEVVSTALANRDSVEVSQDEMTRMADFTEWIKAATPAIQRIAEGLNHVNLVEIYHANRGVAGRDALEGSELGSVLADFLQEREPDSSGLLWEGPAGELLEALEDYTSEATTSSKNWPESPIALGKRLKRLKTTLDKVEIDHEKTRSGGSRKHQFYDKNVTGVTGG